MSANKPASSGDSDLIWRLHNGPAPLDDPNLNDEAADRIATLTAERDEAVKRATGLVVVAYRFWDKSWGQYTYAEEPWKEGTAWEPLYAERETK